MTADKLLTEMLDDRQDEDFVRALGKYDGPAVENLDECHAFESDYRHTLYLKAVSKLRCSQIN
jgi:hypothetical protein